MKYKVGDRIKIYGWQEHRDHYHWVAFSQGENYTKIHLQPYSLDMFRDIENMNCDRIFTIEKMWKKGFYYYKMEGVDHIWGEDMIECFAPIIDRFEILDL
jgi:hypothetical protein